MNRRRRTTTRGAALTAAALCAAALALPSAAGAPAGAPYDPVERAAETLRENQVHVDPDLEFLVGPAERERLEKGLDRIGAPVKVAVLPSVPEHYANPPRLRALVRLVGEDAAYIQVSEAGCFDVNTQKLPKKNPPRIPQQCEPDGKRIADLVLDYARAADELLDGPPGRLTGPVTYGSPRGTAGAGERTAAPADDGLSADAVGRVVAALVLGGALGWWLVRPLTLLLLRAVRQRPLPPSRERRRAEATLGRLLGPARETHAPGRPPSG